ncbi:MAG: response regulator, partial [Eubacterium sp.]|nr:response regulator [Eubacterium sp.]
NVENLTIMADHHCLQQIQIKLLQSAINYTVQGGRIDLEVRELFQTRDMVTLEFSVRDRGIVIDQERLKLLFQPYDYLRKKIDSHIGSLDMDLIILKSYVRAMGSDTLTAESDASRGTRISVTLTVPLAERPAGEARTTNEDTDFSGKRVLVADDNEINLEIIRKILYSKNMNVVSATNGQEAVDIFRRENGQFDLILMDILMPVMDGLEAARKIRTMRDIPGASRVPIVAMTANAFRENFEESFNAGMDAHLVKPVEAERLLMVMSDVMNRKKQD